MRFNTQALPLTAFLLAAVLFLAFSQEWVTGQGGFFGGDLAGIQSVLVPVGSMAQSQFDSILLELWVCPLSLITMLGILLYAIFKNAQAEGKDGQDLQAEFPLTKDKIALWLAGMVVAPVLLLGFLNFCKSTIPPISKASTFDKTEPNGGNGKFDTDSPDTLLINATGLQWWFSFHYPAQGIFTSNEMVFPTHTPVKVNLATKDVIQSFQQHGKVMQGNRMWQKFAEVDGLMDSRSIHGLFDRVESMAVAHTKLFTDDEAEAIAAFLLTLQSENSQELLMLSTRGTKAMSATTEDPRVGEEMII